MLLSRANHRLKSIQTLRGLAILMVVASHVIGDGFAFGGESGVCFFFVISGFVLSLAYTDKVRMGRFSSRRFLVRQLIKFYPLAFLSILFGLVAQWHAGNDIDFPKLFANLLLVQTWFCSERFTFAYSGTSWFLCDILFFYVLFKRLNHNIMRIRMPLLLVSIAVTMVVYATLAFYIPAAMFNYALYTFPVFRLIDCCIGILLYRFVTSGIGVRLFEKTEAKSYCRQCLYLSLLFMLFALSFFAYRDLLPVNFRGVSFFWPFAILLILSLMSLEKSHPLFFSVSLIKVLIFIGDLSMELFLTHEMAIYIVNILSLHTKINYSSPLLVIGLKAVLILLMAFFARKYLVNPMSRRFA